MNEVKDELVTKKYLTEYINKKDFVTKSYFTTHLENEFSTFRREIIQEMERINASSLEEFKRHTGILLEEFQSRMLGVGEHMMSNTERIVKLEQRA